MKQKEIKIKRFEREVGDSVFLFIFGALFLGCSLVEYFNSVFNLSSAFVFSAGFIMIVFSILLLFSSRKTYYVKAREE